MDSAFHHGNLDSVFPCRCQANDRKTTLGSLADPPRPSAQCIDNENRYKVGKTDESEAKNSLSDSNPDRRHLSLLSNVNNVGHRRA